MAHIFKNNNNNKLYTIEHLVKDVRFTNCGANEGIYAYPYLLNGEMIIYRRCDNKNFNPLEFVEKNFTKMFVY